MEVTHTRMVYKHLGPCSGEPGGPPPFETLYASMRGDIIEGGRPLAELEPWIEDARRGGCVELAELALELEFNAYDLYPCPGRP